ncbi:MULTISPECIES: low molecular weight protein-tyrosine-phosphatase [Halopseudomonas]|uniref:protein-tyrosine-phosphatase n=1 Tax=Halopseudomonas pelagia TaxID=553151 RepID=A0AA91Z590_9GAMM|nr:low molecular weight protein-tyrosine-phosphatase [Halopseudomonas pelagia]PCC98419.1 phosphotyrosine protein phosphatase [Halopseudomonas pelagia]QFY57691.1 low molecular weight phosphotyrosine protein phosphatase [Halopseudomonas pelagia]
MIDSILVVCVGNICRSPTAEALLKAKLEGSGITVSSAGLGALVDKPLDATATQVLEAAGYSLPEHKARQITSSMLRQAGLILAMEQRHIQSIHAMAPEARGKTLLLGKWLNNCEVPDPYRQQLPAFEHVYRILDEATSAWLPYLKK